MKTEVKEYLPTRFRNSCGREYTIHVTTRVAAEICRIHNLGLYDLMRVHTLPFHILLDVAEHGTRYQSLAKDETHDEFLSGIGDDCVTDMVMAAGNALLNFSLRAQRGLTEQVRERAAACQGAELQQRQQRIEHAFAGLAGNGETSTASPVSLE